MTRNLLHAFFVVVMIAGVSVLPFAPARAQEVTAEQSAKRDATRDKLAALLAEAGPRIGVTFIQSSKSPHNFSTTLRNGLTNASALEFVVGATARDTIFFRVFPIVGTGYVNIDKVRDKDALTRQLLRFSDDNFLFWGVDSSGDIFAGYNVTLESGFPDAAINVVIQSMPAIDQYVGQLRPAIDGRKAP